MWVRHTHQSHGVAANVVAANVVAYQSHGMKANREPLCGSIELDGSRHDDVTRVQSGMMAAMENLSRMALLNNNIINVNSPMRGSGPDNM